MHRHIESRNRFVENNQLRIECQSASDTNALPLAAGELVRIAIAVLWVEANFAQQIGHAFASLSGSSAMNLERLGNRFVHLHTRVQRRERILEDHSEVGAMWPHGSIR